MSINSKASLDAALFDLERKKLEQEAGLIAQFKVTRESLNPLNLIKNGFSKISEMPTIPGTIMKTILGLGTGILTKKLFLGKSPNIIKKLLSGVFELAIAKTTIHNADKIKAIGISVFNNLFKKRSNHKLEKKFTD